MPDAYYLTSIIGESVLGVAAMIGNGIVLFLILWDRQLQTMTNYFVASLAAADFLVGAIGVPCVIVASHGMPYNFHGCLVVNSMIVILTQISIFGLLCIAVERFFAIRNPFKYQSFCTWRFCLLTIALSWLAAILVGLVPLFGWNLGWTEDNICSFTKVIDLRYMVYFNFAGCVLLPLVLTLLIYIYIYHVVRQHKRAIAALQIPAEVTPPKARKQPSLKNEIKAAKWFAIVIFLFAICWLPIHIINTITVLTGSTCLPCLTAAILLSHFNSAINPVLYALGNTKFQLAWWKLWGQPHAELSTVTGSVGINPAAA